MVIREKLKIIGKTTNVGKPYHLVRKRYNNLQFLRINYNIYKTK